VSIIRRDMESACDRHANASNRAFAAGAICEACAVGPVGRCCRPRTGGPGRHPLAQQIDQEP